MGDLVVPTSGVNHEDTPPPLVDNSDNLPIKTPGVTPVGELPSSGDANQDAIFRLKMARLRHEDVLSPSGMEQPGVPVMQSLRKWAQQSNWHASSILGTDEVNITAAQVAMANEFTKKYRPLEPVGFFESFDAGYDDATLNRLALRRKELEGDELKQFQELLAARNARAARSSSGYTGSIAGAVGQIANTAIERALPQAAAGAAVGAGVGAVSGPGAGLTAGTGAVTGLLSGFLSDNWVQAAGSKLLELDEIPELNDEEELKQGVSHAVGLASTLVERFLGAEALLGKFDPGSLISKFVRGGLSKELIKDQAQKSALTAFGKSMMLSGAAEYSSEFIDQGISILGSYAATKLQDERLDPDSRRDLLTLKNLADMHEAGLIGLGAGMAIGVPHSIAEALQGQETNAGLANQVLAAQPSIAETALSKTAPDVARDMLHAVDLHQKIYLDPDVLDSVSAAALKKMGIDPVGVAASRDLGQYVEISTANLLSAQDKSELESVLPYVKKDLKGELPEASQMNLDTISQEKLVNPQTDPEAISRRALLIKQAQDAQIDRNNKLIQDKLEFDYAKKTKQDEIVKTIKESPALSHEFAARFGGEPHQYAKAVVDVWANNAEYISDGEMSKVDWMNALKIENVQRILSNDAAIGAYGNNKIKLSKSSNGTTFLHEGSHHFLQMWIEASRSNALSEARKSDLEELAKWAGTSLDKVNSNTDEYRKLHEAVAVATEEILYKGKFIESMGNAVRKMFDRIINMFRKYYDDKKIANQEGRVELTPEVEKILQHWMFGATEADMVAARANLLPEQADAELKKLGLSDQLIAVTKSNLSRGLEIMRTQVVRARTRLFNEKRAQYVNEALYNASHSVGRIAILLGQRNKLSAFEVRTLYGDDTVKDFRAKGMIAPGSDEHSILDIVDASGFTLKDFISQLLNPGGEHAVDMMENIRFIREAGNLREEWVKANYNEKDSRIILSIAKTVSKPSTIVPKNPYKFDPSLYTNVKSGDSSLYARTILTDQFKTRFKELYTKAVEILEQKQLDTIIANPNADVTNYKKIRSMLDSKLRSVQIMGSKSMNRNNEMNIGAKAKMFSNADIQFLDRLHSFSELSEIKDYIQDESLALTNAIDGIGSSIAALSDVKENLDRFLETDKKLREIYKTGDWWDQQFFSRWLTGETDIDIDPDVGPLTKMVDAWKGYFNLLDSIKAGDTEGLRHAWLKTVVPPQVFNQLSEITAPPEATGSTEFGTARPSNDFNTLEGEAKVVEKAFTSEERDAETRRMLFAMALIPQNIRKALYEIHEMGGVTAGAANVLGDPGIMLFDTLGMINEKGVHAPGEQINNPDVTSLADFKKEVAKTLDDVDSPFPMPRQMDDLMIHILDTPKSIYEQIEAEVGPRMNDLILNPTPDIVLNNNRYWNHLRDMYSALQNIFETKEGKTNPEVFVDQAREELANMPVRVAIDTKKSFADFARSQSTVKKAIGRNQFRRALIAQNTGLRNYQRVIQGGDLKTQVEKTEKEANRLRKLPQGKIDPKYHSAYLALAHKMGLIKSVPKWAQGAEPGAILEEYSLGHANRIIQTARPEAMFYKDMSVGNFLALNEGLQMLRRLAEVNSAFKTIELTVNGEKTSAKDLSEAGMEELKGYTPKEGMIGKACSKILGIADREVTSMGYLFEALNRFRNVTGKGVTGIFTKLYNEFVEGSRVFERGSGAIGEIHNTLFAFNKIANTMPKVNKDLHVKPGFDSFQWTPDAVFTFCAMYGNEYQSQALRDGYGLTEAQAQQVLDALPDAAWEHVNKIVEILGSRKEDFFGVHEKVEGFRPVLEKAKPFMAGGKMRPGGWVPLYYDHVLHGEARTSVQDLGKESWLALVPPNASTGREKARRATGGRPPQLSTEIFGRGFRDQLHYISFAQPINTYNATMAYNKGSLRNEVQRVLGVEAHKLLDQNIQRLDPKQAEHFRADKGLNRFFVTMLRPASTLGALALNVSSAIKTGPSQMPISMNAVGLSNFCSGFYDMIFNPEMRKFARDSSPHLNETMGPIESTANHMSTKFSEYGIKQYSNLSMGARIIKPALMISHMLMDWGIRYPTWIGAYKMHAHLAEPERIIAADKLVSQTMPIGNVLEKTRIAWNEKSALNFISTFLISASAANNRMKSYYNAWVNKEISDSEFAKMVVTERLMSPFLWTATIPALGFALTGDDDYLEEGFDKKKILVELAGYQLSGLPVVREAFSYGSQKFMDKPASIRPNVLTFSNSVLNHAWQATGGLSEDPKQAAISLAILMGVSQGIPLNLFYDRVMKNLDKNGGDLGEALITGKP